MPYQITDRQAYYLLALIVSMALTFGLLGIMFGYHWDESRIMESARESFQTGNPLPGWYVYPSLPHDLATLVQFTKWFSGIYPGFEEAWKQHLMVRGVFMVYASFGIVFTFLLIRLLTRHNGIALLGAALLAFSWEFGYHSRWIAPDTIMMTNVWACIYWCVKFYQNQRWHLLVLACIFGGLALASKYPAGLVFLPLFYVGILSLPRFSLTPTAIIKRIGVVGGLTSLVFLLVTPGFIFHFKQVIADLSRHIHIYQSGHFGHTLPPSTFSHFWHLLEYFGLAVFSPNRLLSLLGFALVIPGVWQLKHFSGTVNAIWLAFPLTYLAFFLMQDVFIVRNYQVLLPFLFILASLGVHRLKSLKQLRSIGNIAMVLIGIVLACNAYYRLQASLSIINYDPAKLKSRVIEHINAHDNQPFILTKRLTHERKLSAEALPPNAKKGSVDAARADSPKVITLNPERENWRYWKAYRHNLVHQVIGPLEVNMNYYPNWAGYQRALVLPFEHFQQIREAQHDGSD